MKKILILAIFLVFGFCSKSFGQAFGSVTADVFKANQSINMTSTEGANVVIYMYSDEADDNADKWSILNPASTNTLSFQNNGVSELTLSSGGNLVATGSISGTTISGTTGSFVTTLTASGAEGGDVTFNLWSDEGDDAADKFSVVSTATDTLLVKNSTNTLITVTSAGATTFAAAIDGTEAKFSGIATSTGVVCVKSGGDLGQCTSVVDTNGLCTCS